VLQAKAESKAEADLQVIKMPSDMGSPPSRNNNHKVRENPRGLSQLDSYKRGLVNSLTGNLQKFGLDRVAKMETLEEIFSETDETSENSIKDCPETMNQTELKS